MMSSEKIVCLELGTGKVASLLVEEGEISKLEVSSSLGMKAGKIINVERQVQSVKEVLSKVIGEGKGNFSLWVGLSGSYFKVDRVKASIEIPFPEEEIGEKEVKKLLNLAQEEKRRGGAWEVVHSLPLSYQVGKIEGIENPLYMQGDSLTAEIVIVLGLSTSLDTVVRCINKAGYKVDNLCFLPLVEGESVLYPEEREMGVVLVDIGEGTTDMSIYQKGKFQYGWVLNYGGSNFTRRIASVFHIPLAEAERVKKEKGSVLRYLVNNSEVTVNTPHGSRVLNTLDVSQVLEEEAEGWISKILDILKPYLPSLSSGIVITGGGALLKGLKEIMEERTQLPVRIGSPFLEIPPLLPLPSLSGIVGLYLWSKRKEIVFPSRRKWYKELITKVVRWFREKI